MPFLVRRFVVLALGCFAMLMMQACGPTSIGLVVESVDNYSLRNGPSLNNSIANGDGFIEEMTVSGSPWRLKARWTDLNVWDTDFMEPAAVRIGSDNGAFDQPGTAISYFTGHGFCNDGCSTTQCNSTSQCSTPNAALGQRLPGTCRYSPLDNPRCCYMADRAAATSGQFDQRQGVVGYTSGPIRWGESPQSGGWAQAGTDGGTNLVILDISCGILPPFWHEALRNAAAGVHMIGTILIAGGDTANIADRGSTFGKMWSANPEGSVAQAWLDTLSSLPATETGGINGYGCNIIVAMDSTAARAAQRIAESWRDLRSDQNDAQGNNWYSARWQCNYTLPASGRAAWEKP